MNENISFPLNFTLFSKRIEQLTISYFFPMKIMYPSNFLNFSRYFILLFTFFIFRYRSYLYYSFLFFFFLLCFSFDVFKFRIFVIYSFTYKCLYSSNVWYHINILIFINLCTIFLKYIIIYSV